MPCITASRRARKPVTPSCSVFARATTRTPGQRILTLQIEGKPLRTVDMVAEKGRNQPEVFAFPARDENGDGWVDVAVGAAENSPDKNTILNTLWVLRSDATPYLQELLAGRSSRATPGAR